MAQIKPKVTIQNTEKLLDELMFNIDKITDGQIARTFAFSSNNIDYFIQFNQKNMSQGTLNELIYKDKFLKSNIPLRQIVSNGDFLEYKYLITEKTIGKSFEELDDNEFTMLLPEIIKTLKNIANSDTSEYKKYGWLDENGNGKFESWKSHLQSIKDEEPGLFYENWHSLFDSSFLDKDKFYLYFDKMIDLFKYIPEKRELIHSGYCGGNVLFNQNKITAILDWQDARYGDSVYDLAYMIFWMEKDKSKKCIDEYIKAFEINSYIDNLFHRINCYKYYIGLDGMRFAAKTENKEFYEYIMWLLSEI